MIQNCVNCRWPILFICNIFREGYESCQLRSRTEWTCLAFSSQSLQKVKYQLLLLLSERSILWFINNFPMNNLQCQPHDRYLPVNRSYVLSVWILHNTFNVFWLDPWFVIEQETEKKSYPITIDCPMSCVLLSLPLSFPHPFSSWNSG